MASPTVFYNNNMTSLPLIVGIISFVAGAILFKQTRFVSDGDQGSLR
jgi:hypothetical protein